MACFSHIIYKKTLYENTEYQSDSVLYNDKTMGEKCIMKASMVKFK